MTRRTVPSAALVVLVVLALFIGFAASPRAQEGAGDRVDASALWLFAGVFGVACATPGPTIAALVARVLGKGVRGAPAFCLGLLVGDVVWLAAATFGLAMIAAKLHAALLLIKYVGAAYLLVLAWKLWTAPAAPPSDSAPVEGEGIRLFFGGLAIALGNPKTMLFYLALLPSIVPLSRLRWIEFAGLVLTVTIVYSAVLATYILIAARTRRAFTSPRALRIINRGTSAVMAGAAVAVATRQ